jgi:hypothetical protein
MNFIRRLAQSEIPGAGWANKVAEVCEWTQRIRGGPGVRIDKGPDGPVIYVNPIAPLQTEATPHPFRVDKLTGLQVRVNEGIIHSNNIGQASGQITFDTEFIDTSAILGRHRVNTTTLTLPDNKQSLILLRAFYKVWDLEDDGQFRAYSDGYQLTSDTGTWDVMAATFTCDTLLDDFEWPTTKTSMDKIIPIAVVDTDSGEVTTNIQLLKTNWFDAFSVLSSVKLPA